MQLLALQRTAGNAAVVRLVAQRNGEDEQTATQTDEAEQTQPAPAEQPAPAQPAAVDTTDEDRQILQNYRNETQDPAVQTLLDELLPYLNRVTFEQTPGTTGGNTRQVAPGQYSIAYSHPTNMTAHNRIAVLVHELTHVAVNEAYDSDMLNYPVPALTGPERDATMAETPGREEDIQNARMRKGDQRQRNRFIDQAVANVTALLAQLTESGLSPDRQRMIREKLQNHTMPRPFHEYDAVLSHVLTWCDRDGADRSSEFYRRLTGMVAEAAAWRASGAITLPVGRVQKWRDRAKRVFDKLGRIFKRR